MKRTIQVEVSLNGIDVDCSPLFCQGDRNTHFINIHFLEDIDLAGYTLQAYYLPPYPSTIPYVDSFQNPTLDMTIPIPNKLLDRNGVVTVELALSKPNSLITVNEPFYFEVAKTINSTNVTAYPEGVLKETIAEQIEKIKALIAGSQDKINEYNANAEQKTLLFNENAGQKTVNFDNNAMAKQDAFDLNATNKTSLYDTNAKSKLDAYNLNDTQKTNAYNANDKSKTEAYNANDLAKTNAFNLNATQKTTAFDTHVDTTLKTAYADLDKKAIDSATKASTEANRLVKAQETASLKAVTDEGLKQVGLVTAEGDKQVLRVQNTGTTEVSKVNQAGTTAVSNVNATKDAVVKAVTDEGNLQKQNLITQEGLSKKAVTDEGTKQIGLVSGEGTKQVGLVTAEGTKQISAINSTTATKLQDIVKEGTAQKSAITAEGLKQSDALVAEGNKVLDEVRRIVTANPAQGDAVSIGGKTRPEFERETYGAVGNYKGNFPLTSAVLDGIYLNTNTGKFYICIKAYSGASITDANEFFEEINIYENRKKLKELKKDYIKQLTHNFRGLSVTLDINSSSPELEFFIDNFNKDNLVIDKRTIISMHTFAKPETALSQETVKQ